MIPIAPYKFCQFLDCKYGFCFLWIGLLFFISLVSCEKNYDEQGKHVRIDVWAHAGQESERMTLNDQISRFNNSHPVIEVHITFVPEGSYNSQVQASAVSGELPDVLELDGPFLYTYVWQQHLIPLDNLLPKDIVSGLLPSIIAQGTYHNQLWSVGVFDSGLGLYGNRSKLIKANIRIPKSVDDAWSHEEFENALASLIPYDDDGAVLDLKLNYTLEWFTYAFSPFIQSAGGDLINRKTYQNAAGVLNGPASVFALKTIQSWIRKGLVDPNIDDGAFANGRVALSLGGHWNYGQYAAALREDLVLMPLPDWGKGTRTGQGSWNWAITSNCSKPKMAVEFLMFLLQPDEVLAMSNANGAVPGTKTAAQQSELYRSNGPLRLFYDQLYGGYALPRPLTPAYPVITAEFQKAFNRIRTGSDVQKVLNQAAHVIDLEIMDNKGYPWMGGKIRN